MKQSHAQGVKLLKEVHSKVLFLFPKPNLRKCGQFLHLCPYCIGKGYKQI